MSYVRLRNFSLVRSTSRSVTESVILANSGVKPTMSSLLWAAHIGPYGAIDAIWVSLPPSLARVVLHFQAELMRRLQQHPVTLAAMADHALPQSTYIMPKAWAGHDFRGGNPMCETADPTPLPFAVSTTPFSVYFAVLAMQQSSFDRITCIMSGLLTFHTAQSHFLFDIKSWSVLWEPTTDTTQPHHRRYSCLFETPTFDEPPATPAAPVAKSPFRPADRLVAVGGLLYMVFSVAGSVLYISTTEAETTNDFWWSEFNATGAYGFLGSWVSTQLLLNPSGLNDTLDYLAFADSMPYNSSSTVISSSALYANLQDASALPMAIRGLRCMGYCAVPEIMTAYCWVDFKQRFPMAHSERRQVRCVREYAGNGAVYLESALSNVAPPSAVPSAVLVAGGRVDKRESDVVCVPTSGSGSSLACPSSCVCYAFQRECHRHLQNDRHDVSLLFASSVKYLFTMDNWKNKNVYYLDKASTVITGLLCVEYNHVCYVFDIKLWRVFAVKVPAHVQAAACAPHARPSHVRVSAAWHGSVHVDTVTTTHGKLHMS
ncbi:hypothetical protein DYB35_001288 [Aphanomyces astaci]|uniref:Uncharacterized protein n=1 Tax=Aphanomyces astaci TaxID=112090 RepID=A0A3R7AQF6_APHAT|nr:hypothetical protein DYB35_001288 [Aphanomyces astaci]